LFLKMLWLLSKKKEKALEHEVHYSIIPS
jgi:hypothetical protein